MLSAPVISILPIAPASIMTAFVSCFRWSSISRTSTFEFAKKKMKEKKDSDDQ